MWAVATGCDVSLAGRCGCPRTRSPLPYPAHDRDVVEPRSYTWKTTECGEQEDSDRTSNHSHAHTTVFGLHGGSAR